MVRARGLFFSFCVLSYSGQVTVLSVLPVWTEAQLPPTYHHVFLNLSDTDDWGAFRTKMLNNDTKTDLMQLARIPLLMKMLTRRSNEILRHEMIQHLFHSGQRFDLFVLGYHFNDPLLGIAAHFRCPSVVLTPTPALKMVRDFVGNPAEIATTPIFSKSGVTEVPPKFLTRFLLFIGYTIEYAVVLIANNFVHETVYANHFPSARGYPTFDEMKRNVSLVLVNHHFSQGDFRPLYPNIVDIGGIQIRAKPKPLPRVSVEILVCQIIVIVSKIAYFPISGHRSIHTRCRTWFHSIQHGQQSQNVRNEKRHIRNDVECSGQIEATHHFQI